MKNDSKTFAEYPDVVTIQEMQQMLRISRQTAYSLIHNGRIPSRKFGRVYRIRKEDIIRFFEQ